MNAETRLDTPQLRLAQNRQRMLAQMRGEDEPPSNISLASATDAEAGQQQGNTAWELVKRAAQAWWESHPARFVAQMAEPALHDYAREQPLKLVGLAAGAGAVAVVLKPWRLVSLGALLAVALRPVDMSSLVLALVSQRGNPQKRGRNG